ncbi:unnamed protein product, partial [Mesorhabditis spiculigera]
MVAHSDPDAIVETLITWDMVEQDAQRQYKTTAKTGPKRSAVHLGDQNGYVSKCALVTFDWTEEQDRLPREGVMKIVFRDKIQKLSDMANGAYDNAADQARTLNDTELQFYKEMAELDEKPDIPLPRFVCGRPYGIDGLPAGYLIVEKVNDFHNIHIYQDLEEVSALAGLEVMSNMAAYSLEHPENARKLAENRTFETHFGDFSTSWKVERGIDNMGKRFPDKAEQLQELKKVSKYFATIETLVETMLQNTKLPMLVHGDLWPGNILWRKEENGDYLVKLVVDWQIAHIGNPCEDLVRFLSKGLGGKEYATRRDFYLEAFYNGVVRQVQGKQLLPWKSLAEFIAEYERIFPLVFLVWFPPFIQLVSDEQIMGTGEDAAQRLETFRVKFRGLVDEAIRCVEKRY